MPTLLTTGAVAFLYCVALTPLLRTVLVRRGLTEQRGETAIPRMGGVAVIAAAAGGLGTILLFGIASRIPMNAQDASMRDLVVPVLLVMLVGVADDIAGLSPLWKFSGQVAAAVMVVASGIHIRLLLYHPLAEWLAAPLTVVWLVGCSNAFNLIDGMDGLAAGLALFATGTVLAHAVLTGQPVLALLTASLFGALAGFLMFNFHPATIFLGDAGSLAVGFLLGALALLWADKATTFVGLLAPAFALAVPILDTGIAIFRRFARQQAIFARDQDHIHHRLIHLGLNQRNAVLMLYAVGGIGAVASLVLADLHRRLNSELVILLLVLLVAVGIQQLGYTELTEAGKRLGSEFRQRAVAEAAMQRLAEAAEAATDLAGLSGAVAAAALELGFAGSQLWIDDVTYRSPGRSACDGVVHGAGTTGGDLGPWFWQIPLRAGERATAGLRLMGPWERSRGMAVDELSQRLRRALEPGLTRFCAGAGVSAPPAARSAAMHTSG